MSGSRSDPIDLTGNHSGGTITCDDLFPPPVDMSADGEEIYRVERIVGLKRTAAGVFYLVKWFGYPLDESTMVHERDTRHCQDAVRAFRQQCERR